MGLKRKFIIAALALGSLAVITGVGAPAAGAATPDNLISNGQYDMLWEGMTLPATQAFLGKTLTLTAQQNSSLPNGTPYTAQIWSWDATFGNCEQYVDFLFVNLDEAGNPSSTMYLIDWQRTEYECQGIVK